MTIVTADRKPNPAYTAAKALKATFNGYRFERRLDLGLFTDNDFALRLVKNGSVGIAFWTMEEQHQATLPVGPGEGVLVDFTGNRKPLAWQTQLFLAATSGKAEIEATHRSRDLQRAAPVVEGVGTLPDPRRPF